jgi:cold shock CspA family protein
MQNFGKVESYDNNTGKGLITPEIAGSKALPFDRSAFGWSDKQAPTVGRRLSYEVSETNGDKSAIKLNHA